MEGKNKSLIKSENDESPALSAEKPLSRRVSFASSNFIKKFSIDPERNTVWDATYEEIITMDSTSDSLDNAHGTFSVHQACVTDVDQSHSKKGDTSHPTINFYVDGGEDMDCDVSQKETAIMNKENLCVVNADNRQIGTCASKKNHKPNRRIATIKNAHMSALTGVNTHNATVLDEVNMELTKLLSPIICESRNNVTCYSNSPMECTIINDHIAKQNDTTNKTIIDNKSFEYTCQVPNLPEKTEIISKNTTIIHPDSMELTTIAETGIICENKFTTSTTICQIPVNECSTDSNRVTTLNIEKNQSTPLVNNQVEDSISNNEMDITKPIHTNNAAITNSEIHKESCNMEFTQIISSDHIVNLQPFARTRTVASKNSTFVVSSSNGPSDNMNVVTHGKINKDSEHKIDSRTTLNNKTQSDASEVVESMSKNVTATKSLPVLTLSLCTDDTQHLINYNLSGQPSKSDFSKIITGDLSSPFINSKVMALSDFSCDTSPISLENTRDRSGVLRMRAHDIDNKTNLAERPSTDSTEKVIQRKKLNVDWPSSRIKNTERESNELLNISQENLTLDTLSSLEGSMANPAQEVITNTVNVSTPLHDELAFDTLWDTLNNNKSFEEAFIESKLKIESLEGAIRHNASTFKLQCEEELQILSQSLKESNLEEEEEEKSNSDFSSTSSWIDPVDVNNQLETFQQLQSSSDSAITIEKIVTFEEQITKKCRRSKKYWTVISIEKNLCKIFTLFNTIRLEINFNEENGDVFKINMYSLISDDSEPDALLVNKICKERLNEKNIQSAVGEKYDILTLLDYVYINMQKMLDILNEFNNFLWRYNFKLDKNFIGTFDIIKLYLPTIWSFSVNMSDLENVSESFIKCITNIGAINEKEIKKLTDKKTTGLIFLKKFFNDVEDYADSLASRKHANQ